jgi:hypothetical protein
MTKYSAEVYAQTYENIISLATKYHGKAFVIQKQKGHNSFSSDLTLSNGTDTYLFVSTDMDPWVSHFMR